MNTKISKRNIRLIEMVIKDKSKRNTLKDMLKKELELCVEYKKRVKRALNEDNPLDWQYAIYRLDYHETRVGLLKELLKKVD